MVGAGLVPEDAKDLRQELSQELIQEVHEVDRSFEEDSADAARQVPLWVGCRVHERQGRDLESRERQYGSAAQMC